MGKKIWNPLHQLFLLNTFVHTKDASIRSSCIYEDVNYPFEDVLYILKLTLTVLSLIRDRVLSIWPTLIRYGEYDVTMTSHYVGLCQNTKTFKIWNIDEKKYQKMEVSKFLYFALVNFHIEAIYSMILDFASWAVYWQLTSLFTTHIGQLSSWHLIWRSPISTPFLISRNAMHTLRWRHCMLFSL